VDYQIVKQQYPDDIDLNSLIGTCHMKLNDPAEAVFAFDDALRLSPNHVDLLLAKGGAYASLGKFQSAW
jgi:cytochrome c-type biogenesis protein CcmH/NrfG